MEWKFSIGFVQFNCSDVQTICRDTLEDLFPLPPSYVPALEAKKRLKKNQSKIEFEKLKFKGSYYSQESNDEILSNAEINESYF